MSNATRVLVIDDEPQIIRFLKPALTAAGYDVSSVGTGREGLAAIAKSAPDVVLLDLGLPDMDGKDVVREVRLWSPVPILILSVRDREAEKIEALDLGADDYVQKPFGIGELTARLRATLRRKARESSEEVVFRAGDLCVDTLKRTVTKAGNPVKLTRKEYDLLALLVRHAGRVVTHRQLLSAVWGPAHTEDTQYLRVFVAQLRAKIDGGGDHSVIQTEAGIGYRLIA